MPLAECGFKDTDQLPAPALLELHGPTLLVDVGFDANYDGKTPGAVPKPAVQTIPALIDTGATLSCIDDDLAKELGLPLVDRQKIGGVGGVHEVPVYLAQVFAPIFGFTQYGQFHGVALRAGGQPHQALIGRTFLRDFVMIYDGVRGQVTLAR